MQKRTERSIKVMFFITLYYGIKDMKLQPQHVQYKITFYDSQIHTDILQRKVLAHETYSSLGSAAQKLVVMQNYVNAYG